MTSCPTKSDKTYARLYDLLPTMTVNSERGSCMVWEINMGVCPRLDFENIMLFICLGYNFNIYGAFEFLCNCMLIYDVMNDITIIP